MTAAVENTLWADVVVIGFGKGGKVAAATLGRAGRRVILIERSDQMYGGTCPNVGCVPTKALVHHSGRRRPDDSPQEWFEHAIGEVQALTSTFRAGNYEALNGAEWITVLTGTAHFVDAHTVAVSNGSGEVRVVGETILVNTGSEPVIPGILGLRESPRTVTNVDLIHTTHLPGRLAVIGGGYLGIEFASIYRRFGTAVTVLEASPRILGREDDDIAAAAAEILAGDGVEVVTGAEVLEIRGEDTVVYRKDGREHSLTVDAILAATGRTPATAELRLENAGVKTTDGGAIEVDEHLRTSQSHIFALGDVNGGPQFTYISLDDSRIVLDQLLGSGQRSTADRIAVPQTLFMSPPLATVGLTEKAARAAGHRVRIGMQRVADIVAMPRAYIVEETRGVMKFVIDAASDEILGAALLSVDAQELINTVALAMRHRITATELRESIYTHPSSTEAFNDVLGTIVRS
ncbi:FAD-dependent oxidoreductase [Kribbella sp. NPDC050281]|uniref:FAD-dependent oxidoreductase n=1 Tax=Kribbella sp. NPDC050281 TaxID=3155515 RepID=UPI0033ECAA87